MQAARPLRKERIKRERPRLPGGTDQNCRSLSNTKSDFGPFFIGVNANYITFGKAKATGRFLNLLKINGLSWRKAVTLDPPGRLCRDSGSGAAPAARQSVSPSVRPAQCALECPAGKCPRASQVPWAMISPVAALSAQRPLAAARSAAGSWLSFAGGRASGGVAVQRAARLGEDPGGRGVAVAEGLRGDRGECLQDELAERGRPAGAAGGAQIAEALEERDRSGWPGAWASVRGTATLLRRGTRRPGAAACWRRVLGPGPAGHRAG